MNMKYNSLPEIDVSELKHKGMSTHEAVFRGKDGAGGDFNSA